MPIELAFSTAACPRWTLQRVAEQAGKWQFDAVELRSTGLGGGGLACDPALTAPGRIRSMFADAGVGIVCLSADLDVYHESTARIARTRDALRTYIDMASEVGCSAVRVFVLRRSAAHPTEHVFAKVAECIEPVGEQLIHQGVRLLFENAGSMSTSKAWWWLLDRLEHPMMGLAWNLATSVESGEPVSVSLPTLNGRIVLPKLRETCACEGKAEEGTVHIGAVLRRLLGIGFSGPVSVEWDRLAHPEMPPADQLLPSAKQCFTDCLDTTRQASDGKFGNATPSNKEAQKLLQTVEKNREKATAENAEA